MLSLYSNDKCRGSGMQNRGKGAIPITRRAKRDSVVLSSPFKSNYPARTKYAATEHLVDLVGAEGHVLDAVKDASNAHNEEGESNAGHDLVAVLLQVSRVGST
jgi:hypothetical protein